MPKRGISRMGTDNAVVFAVRLSHAPTQTVTVDWTTADGAGPWARRVLPATAGADCTATSGTLTFAAGETAKTVSVAILDDAIDEGTAFPVRVHSEADLLARDRGRIEAWENPFARDGPASPFLAGEAMLEAEGSPTAPPLLPYLAGARAH